jgi:thiol-disulfide isomerase/thioredoxin
LQTRTIGWIITAALLLFGQAGCRNLPRGGGLGLGLRKSPEVRTIASIGSRRDRPTAGDQAPSTISSRVDPPPGDGREGQVVGKVVDDRGVPVANARVRLAVTGAPAGREVEGTTNRSGAFLLKGLRPGERYTLIAEWDDGQDLLLGRSSISAPAEEVEIRVASAASERRAEVTSGTRLESSGVALFNPEDRAPVREAPPARTLQDPVQPEPGRGPEDRSRAQWIPADSVRRASLDPDRDVGVERTRDRPARSVPRSEPDDLRLDFPEPSLGTGSQPDRSAVLDEPEGARSTPEMGPTPGTFDPPSSLSSLPDPARGPEPGPRKVAPRTEPTYRYRGQDAPMPAVQHFEPQSERDRDVPDPPLLMTDVPPEAGEQPDRSGPEGVPPAASTPGSFQLASPPSPMPEASPEPSPPGGSMMAPGVGSRDAVASNPTIDPEPPTIEAPDDPEPKAVAPPSLADGSEGPEVVAEATEPPVVISRPPDDPAEAQTPVEEPQGSFRWSDLPPPARLADSETRIRAEEPVDSDRPEGWASGLLRLVGRDRVDDLVEPVVLYNEEQARLEDFTLPDLQGRPFQLRSTDAEFTLLCFWGTWCDPCLAAMPHLDELQRQFGREKLRVVSIAYQREGEGGPRTVARTSRRLGLDFPILIAPGDGSCPVAEAMEVRYYPTMILLDREGRVVHRETGATGEKLMRLDRAIASAMDESILTITRR